MIIAVANQKGGCGKTTTTFNLGYVLAEGGRSVLLIDLDPQSSLTVALNFDAEGRSMFEVMGTDQPGSLGIGDIVERVSANGELSLFLAPSDISLARSEMGLIQRYGRENVLKKAIANARPDYILIDCPPNLGILVVNALVAAQKVLIPVQPEYLGLRGLAVFYETFHQVQRELNPALSILGILPTFLDRRLTHHRKILAAMYRQGLPVLDITIAKTIRLAEAALAHQSIFEYNGSNPAAESYRQLAEVIDAQKT